MRENIYGTLTTEMDEEEEKITARRHSLFNNRFRNIATFTSLSIACIATSRILLTKKNRNTDTDTIILLGAIVFGCVPIALCVLFENDGMDAAREYLSKEYNLLRIVIIADIAIVMHALQLLLRKNNHQLVSTSR